MPNRFIFSLRYFSKVMIQIGIIAAAMIVFMSLFRVNLYFLSVFHATPNAVPIEIFQSFLAGLRFDTLVVGFVLVPVYFVLLFQAIIKKWPAKMFIIYRAYFLLVWIAICSLTVVDFMYFTQMGRRMRFADYQSWNLGELVERAQQLPDNQFWVFSTISVLLFFLGWMLIQNIKLGHWKDEYSPNNGSRWEASLRIVVPLLVIFLAARGTVEPHHLRLEHSEVSLNPVINEMALNAVWCFDK